MTTSRNNQSTLPNAAARVGSPSTRRSRRIDAEFYATTRMAEALLDQVQRESGRYSDPSTLLSALDFLQVCVRPASDPQWPILARAALPSVDPALWLRAAIDHEKPELLALLHVHGVEVATLRRGLEWRWDDDRQRFEITHEEHSEAELAQLIDEEHYRDNALQKEAVAHRLLAEFDWANPESPIELFWGIAAPGGELGEVLWLHGPYVGQTHISWLTWALTQAQEQLAEEIWSRFPQVRTPRVCQEALLAMLLNPNPSLLWATTEAIAKTRAVWVERLLEGQDLLTPIPVRRFVVESTRKFSSAPLLDTKYHLMQLLEQANQAASNPNAQEADVSVDMTGVLLRALAMGGAAQEPQVRLLDLLLAQIAPDDHKDVVPVNHAYVLARLSGVAWGKVGMNDVGQFPAVVLMDAASPGKTFRGGFYGGFRKPNKPKAWKGFHQLLAQTVAPLSEPVLEALWTRTLSLTFEAQDLGGLQALAPLMQGRGSAGAARQAMLHFTDELRKAHAQENSKHEELVKHVCSFQADVLPLLRMATQAGQEAIWNAFDQGLTWLARLQDKRDPGWEEGLLKLSLPAAASTTLPRPRL